MRRIAEQLILKKSKHPITCFGFADTRGRGRYIYGAGTPIPAP